MIENTINKNMKDQDKALEILSSLKVKKNLAEERKAYFQKWLQRLQVERVKILKKNENKNYYKIFKNYSRVLKYKEKNNFFKLNNSIDKKIIFKPLLKEHKNNLRLKFNREEKKKKKREKEEKEKNEREKKERESLELLKEERKNYIP
jgi:hypothetical protein